MVKARLSSKSVLILQRIREIPYDEFMPLAASRNGGEKQSIRIQEIWDKAASLNRLYMPTKPHPLRRSLLMEGCREYKT